MMRYPARYWLAGGVASLIAHGLVVMAVTSTKSEIRIERGAGATVVVTTLTSTRAIAGENSVAALEAVEPEAEPPKPTEAEIDPTRPDTTASRTPVEAKPAETVEVPASEPRELAASTSWQRVAAIVPERISTVSTAEPVSEVRPTETNQPLERSEVQPASNAASQPPEAPQAPEAQQADTKASPIVSAVSADETKLTEAAPVSRVDEVDSRENVSSTDTVPTPEETAAPTRPDSAPSTSRNEAKPVLSPTELAAKQPEDRPSAEPAKASEVRDARPATAEATTAEAVKPADAETVEEAAAADPVTQIAKTSEPTAVEPKEAKAPTAAVTEPRKVIAPVKPREKATVKRNETPEKKSRKTAKKQKKSKPRKSGRQRVASVRRSGSTSLGRSTRVAGDGGRNQKATGSANISNYLGKIVSRLQRQKRYPSGAKRKKLQGTAVIAFTVKSNGRVGGIRLKRSSGHPVLDREVRAMLRRAAPFPPIPKSSRRRALSLSVPITFRMR